MLLHGIRRGRRPSPRRKNTTIPMLLPCSKTLQESCRAKKLIKPSTSTPDGSPAVTPSNSPPAATGDERLEKGALGAVFL